MCPATERAPAVLGFTWTRPEGGYVLRQAADAREAAFYFKRNIAEHVWHAMVLERNPCTLAQTQTILTGVTVGGLTIPQQRQVENMGKACELLFSLVKEGRFALSKQMACDLHALVAKEEALTWGTFRTKPVTIAGTNHKPPPADALDALFDGGCTYLESDLPEPTERALALFLFMARSQFFFDGNKRTGRLLMNGLLMSHGFHALTIGPEHVQAFNEKMLAFYDTGNGTEMMDFLASLGRTT